MALPACPECRAIFEELVHLVELSRLHSPGPNANILELIAWFEQRNVDEDYKARIRPALAEARRRLIEHQTQTGHSVPRPFSPGGFVTPN